MAFATFDDVQARYHLPIDAELRPLVEIRLDDAEAKIRSRIPALDELILQGRVAEATVIRVTAEAVIRLVRNPDGYVSETDGSYTYQLGYGSGTSELTITKEDWRDLGVRRGISVVHVGPELPWEAGG